MTAQDKRARKKQHRDEIRAAQEAELRRRRNIRLLVLVGLIVALVVGAIAFGGEDEGEPAPKADQQDEKPEAACGAEAPPEAAPKEYDKPPGKVIEEGVDYSATIHTSCGEIVIDLLEDEAPENVNNFVFLAQEGYYEGLIWHRVESDSVIQAGDPNGQNGVPPDGPGYTIKDELPEKSKEYVYGVVGMANAGPNTAGSQFFIVTRKQGPAGYQPFYSIFARVLEGETDATEEEIGCKSPGEPGVPTLDAIGCQPTNQGASSAAEAVKPIVPIYIESIEIHEG